MRIIPTKKKSDEIKIKARNVNIEEDLPYEMTREELGDKILSDPEFRKEIKEKLGEKGFNLLITSI